MDRLWGEVQGVPPELVRVVPDNGVIAAGGEKFVAIATPGHASHHHAYWIARESTLFGGDAAGVGMLGGPLLPPCPPPDINVEAWIKSLERIQDLKPKHLWISHFGQVEAPEFRLRELAPRLTDWANWMREQLSAGFEPISIVPLFEARVVAELRAAGVSDHVMHAYEQADPAAMNVFGLARYWQKFHSRNAK